MHRDTYSVAVAIPKMEDNLKTILAISPPGAEKREAFERYQTAARAHAMALPMACRYRITVLCVGKHILAS